MRLIDADALTNEICGCKCKECMYNNKGCIEDDVFEIANTLQAIHDAPTAYDIDKVTDALIHSKEINEVDNTEWVNLTEAIMIVRNNGEI